MQTTKMHSDCIRLGNKTIISLQEINREPTTRAFLLEVGQQIGDTYEPQRIFVNANVLLAIHDLIAPLADGIKAFQDMLATKNKH